ncbi:MAG: hypothetical protein AB7E68_02655 [Candidatus Babeliales bacterium]
MHNGRYPDLVKVLRGFQETGVPLVMHNGSHPIPYLTDGADDIGIYLFIPKIAKMLNLSLDQALNLFFYGIIFGSALLGILGFCLLYKSTKARIIAFFGIAISLFLPIKINDVYAIGSCLSIAIVPFYLYLIKEKKPSNIIYIFLFCSGIAIGLANNLRSYSGIGVLLFLLTLLFTHIISIKQKIILCLFIFSGIALPNLYITKLVNKYTIYANTQFKENVCLNRHHPFWHNFYIGFGFINCLNRPGIQWDDGYAYNKAKEIDPSLDLNDANKIDSILKGEVFKLLLNDSFFVFSCLFAKIGVLIFLLLKYANIFFIGSVFSLFSIEKWKLKLAFIVLIIFNSLYPLVAIPFPEYSIGLITAAILYGILIINSYSKEQKNYSYFYD